MSGAEKRTLACAPNEAQPPTRLRRQGIFTWIPPTVMVGLTYGSYTVTPQVFSRSAQEKNGNIKPLK